MQNLFTGYVFGLLLLFTFLAISYNSSKKIDHTINQLANYEIPSLIAASNLKKDFQAQTIALYALYATNDENAYQRQFIQTKSAILIDATKLQALLGQNEFAHSLDTKILAREEKANHFVEIMRQPEVDWDAARSSLSEFSADAEKIEFELDQTVAHITQKTQAQTLSSQTILAQLSNIGLLFAGLFIVGLCIQIAFTSNERH
jgi:hypothetical protein